MPTFDFQCTNCNTIFEFSRPFGSTEHPPCPECQSKKTEKLIAPPAIHFKGQGFYKTDSAGKTETTKFPEPTEKKEDAKKEKKDAVKKEPKNDVKKSEP